MHKVNESNRIKFVYVLSCEAGGWRESGEVGHTWWHTWWHYDVAVSFIAAGCGRANATSPQINKAGKGWNQCGTMDCSIRVSCDQTRLRRPVRPCDTVVSASGQRLCRWGLATPHSTGQGSLSTAPDTL